MKKRSEPKEEGMMEEDDEDTKVTDQFMRDPHDLMTFYQTNMLCEAFTDVNKFYLSESELLLEEKITELYSNIEDLMGKEECNVIEKLNKVMLGKKSNHRAQQMMDEKDPISSSYFLNSLIDKDADKKDNDN